MKTISDITNGYTVRIRKADGSSWFIASRGTPDNPTAHAFFLKHAKARAFVKELKEHGMHGRIMRAQLILKTD